MCALKGVFSSGQVYSKGGSNGINQTVRGSLSLTVSSARAVEKPATSRTKNAVINIRYMINLFRTISFVGVTCKSYRITRDDASH